MPTLYDADGRPIRSSELEREHARADIFGLRSPYVTSQASTLTPERLARLLRAADEGDTEAIFTLAEEMEIRDPHYGSVLRTRKHAVAGCEVMVEAISDDARDVEIADALREEVVEKPEFANLLFDLMDGVAKGISLVEMMWETRSRLWAPKSYEWRNPSWFMWDRETLSEPRLRSLSNPAGEPLAPHKWVIHRPKLKSGLTLRNGLARMAVTAFLMKSYTLRDLMAFMDLFGIPTRLGRYDPQKYPKLADQLDLLRKIASIGSDAAAVLPKDVELDTAIKGQGTTGGEKLFLGAADWWDRQVSKAVLGQTMTTDDGSSRAQAQVHDEVRLDIKKADARALEATLRRDIATPFVAFNFGPEARVPKVTVVVEEPEDRKLFMETVKIAVDLGMQVEESVVRDKLGLPDPEPGAKLLSRSASPAPTAGATPPAPSARPRDPTPPAPDDETLRAQNRALVRSTIAALNRREQDEIDRLVEEELGAWRPVVDPSIGTLIAQIEAAESVEAAQAILRRAASTMDLERFTDALAAAMLKARGIGDARDDA